MPDKNIKVIHNHIVQMDEMVGDTKEPKQTEDWTKELFRLASLVGTDAKNPEEKLFDYVNNLLSHQKKMIREEITRFSGRRLPGIYNCPLDPFGQCLECQKRRDIVEELLETVPSLTIKEDE